MTAIRHSPQKEFFLFWELTKHALLLPVSSQTQNLGELSQLGHFLKGSSATLGLTKVKDACEKIQHYGDQKDESGTVDEPDKSVSLGKIRKALEEVRKDYDDVVKLLKRFYGEKVTSWFSYYCNFLFYNTTAAATWYLIDTGHCLAPRFPPFFSPLPSHLHFLNPSMLQIPPFISSVLYFWISIQNQCVYGSLIQRKRHGVPLAEFLAGFERCDHPRFQTRTRSWKVTRLSSFSFSFSFYLFLLFFDTNWNETWEKLINLLNIWLVHSFKKTTSLMLLVVLQANAKREGMISYTVFFILQLNNDVVTTLFLIK